MKVSGSDNYGAAYLYMVPEQMCWRRDFELSINQSIYSTAGSKPMRSEKHITVHLKQWRTGILWLIGPKIAS